MNICIIGDGLSSLSLANYLVNKKINVHIYYKKKKKNLSLNQTIGISEENFKFFNKEILNITNNFWGIKEIEIYSEKLGNEKVLNFKNNSNLFYMLKNYEIYNLLKKKLSKNVLYKKIAINSEDFYQKILKNNKYNLIINCDSKNLISKKYFSKQFNKKYNNCAFITTLKHKNINNKTAVQIFTKYGPLAYLPISQNETSVVYSLDVTKRKFNDKTVIELIKKYNKKYLIKKIEPIDKFELTLSNLRNYYYKNILAFGDCLHKIHPLAGQGFNMTIRDIKVISNIIQSRIDIGMEVDPSIFSEFENKTKHINFIFSNSIDFIYEFFNFDKELKNKNFTKIVKIIGKNKILNDVFIKYADRGLRI